MPDATFRTVLPLPRYERRIGPADRLLCMGSCFAEHMGRRLADGKLSVVLNPFGILYQPLVLARALHRLLEGQEYGAEELIKVDGVYRHYDFHSRLADPDPGRALQLMNDSLRRGREQLLRADHLLLTLGTAGGFYLRSSGEPVANCHRQPGDFFDRRRSRPAEVAAALGQAIAACRAHRPELSVLISVSPVRHLRDGPVENQRSKATLVLAAEQLCKEVPHVHYFPALELLLDDLRDYRFYDRDLAHPSATAIDYVWDYFRRSLLDEQAARLVDAAHDLQRAMDHRPLFPGSQAHQQFVRAQLQRIRQLADEFPKADWQAEQSHFKAYI